MTPAEATVHSAIEAGIEAAADLIGIEVSAFVVMAADARAQELPSGKHQSMLTLGDHQARLAVLDEDPRPTLARLEAWQMHQDQETLVLVVAVGKREGKAVHRKDYQRRGPNPHA